MKALYHSLLFIFMFSGFASCKKNKEKNSDGIFKEQLLNVIDSLENKEVKLYKYLLKDGKTDTVYINNPDWQKELFLFTNTILSVKSLKNFDIKKTNNNNSLTTEYTAKDSSEIKKVMIKNDSLGINYNIHYCLKNRLATIEYRLSINFNKGYLIESIQKVPYSYQTYFRIEGLFK